MKAFPLLHFYTSQIAVVLHSWPHRHLQSSHLGTSLLYQQIFIKRQKSILTGNSKQLSISLQLSSRILKGCQGCLPGRFIIMDQNSTTDQIGSIIKIYSTWKQQHPSKQEQCHAIELKLNPKYHTKTHLQNNQPLSPLRKQINHLELKSKELIPEYYLDRLEDSPRGTRNREEQNIRIFMRKKIGKSPLTRFHSLQGNNLPRQNSNKIIHLNFVKTARSHTTAHIDPNPAKSPLGTHKQFRLKKTSTVREVSPEPMSPRFKIPSLQKFCESSKRQKDNFLKGMILGDIQVLSKKCKVDMDEFLIKIRRQERLRKARAIYCWSSFNYNQIQN